MDNLVHPFPCPIYQNIIDKESFLQIKKDTDNFIKNSFSLFQKPFLCPTFSTFNVPVEKNINSEVLNIKIKHSVKEYSDFWNWSSPPLMELNECWVNIAKKGAYQETHNHGNVLMSGVIYINVNKQSGSFQFINPLASESTLLGQPNNTFGYLYNVIPQPGMILLFPGWMDHRALPNESDIDRISISFNIKANFK
jgi:uncharacterized protein (TIGR02466 family)